MKYCSRCKVSLPDNPESCPLCQGDIEGKGDKNTTYPFFPPIRPHRTLLTWIAFGAVAVGVISIAVNLSFPFGGWWSLFVIGGILSLWISFVTFFKKRSNIPKSILWQVAIVTVLSLIWDYVTGYHGWALNFVIPVFSTCAMVLMAAVSKILKLHIEEYIIYLVIDGVFGLVSFILIILDVVSVVYPSAICFACSVISLAALFIFEGKALKMELRRRTHL